MITTRPHSGDTRLVLTEHEPTLESGCAGAGLPTCGRPLRMPAAHAHCACPGWERGRRPEPAPLEVGGTGGEQRSSMAHVNPTLNFSGPPILSAMPARTSPKVTWLNKSRLLAPFRALSIVPQRRTSTPIFRGDPRTEPRLSHSTGT